MFRQAKHPRALLAICVFTVAAVVAVALFESSGSFFVAATDPVAQINDDFATHLQNIHSMNVSSIVQSYTSDASVQFNVQGQTGTGNRTGIKNIGNLFAASIFPAFAVPNFTARNSTVTVTGNTATLDSTFNISGYNSDANPQAARVSAHAVFVRQSGAWLISYEEWTFSFPSGAIG